MAAKPAEPRRASSGRRAPPRNLDVARLIGFYRTMLRIRAFEEAALQGLEEKLVLGAIHPSIGQEAVAVGVCANLDTATCCSRRTAATATPSPRAPTPAP